MNELPPTSAKSISLHILVTYDPENEVVPWTVSIDVRHTADNTHRCWLPFINWHDAFAFFADQDWDHVDRIFVRWDGGSNAAH